MEKKKGLAQVRFSLGDVCINLLAVVLLGWTSKTSLQNSDHMALTFLLPLLILQFRFT